MMMRQARADAEHAIATLSVEDRSHGDPLDADYEEGREEESEEESEEEEEADEEGTDDDDDSSSSQGEEGEEGDEGDGGERDGVLGRRERPDQGDHAEDDDDEMPLLPSYAFSERPTRVPHRRPFSRAPFRVEVLQEAAYQSIIMEMQEQYWQEFKELHLNQRSFF